MLDSGGRVVYSSPAGHRMLGYPSGFWIGHNVFELVHPDDAPRVMGLFAGAGFRLARVVPTTGEISVLEAVPV